MELEHKHKNLQQIICYAEDNIESIKNNSERIIAAGYVGSRAQGLEIEGSDHDVWLITVPTTDRLIHLNDSKDNNKLTVKSEFTMDLMDKIKGEDGINRDKYIHSTIQLSVMDIRKFLRSLIKPNLRCFEFLTSNYIINDNDPAPFSETIVKTWELFDYLSMNRYRILQSNLQSFTINIRGLIQQRVKDCEKWVNRWESSKLEEMDHKSLIHLVVKEHAHIQRLNQILEKSKELFLDQGLISEIKSNSHLKSGKLSEMYLEFDKAMTYSQFKTLRCYEDVLTINSTTSEKEIKNYISYPLFYSETTFHSVSELVTEMSNEIISTVNHFKTESNIDPLEECRIKIGNRINQLIKRLVETFIAENYSFKEDCLAYINDL